MRATDQIQQVVDVQAAHIASYGQISSQRLRKVGKELRFIAGPRELVDVLSSISVLPEPKHNFLKARVWLSDVVQTDTAFFEATRNDEIGRTDTPAPAQTRILLF